MRADRAVLVAVVELVAVAQRHALRAPGTSPGTATPPKISWRMSWNSRRISHWAIVHRRRPDMWMSARRFVVMTRFVRVALGNTNRASSPGTPAPSSSPYSPSAPSTCASIPSAQLRVAPRRSWPGASSPRPCTSRSAGSAGRRRRPARWRTSWCDRVRDTPESANVNTMCSIVEPWPDSMTLRDQALHRRRRDLAVHRAAEDLLGLQLRVARAAGGVDERDVELLHDLPGRGTGAWPSCPARGGRDCRGSRSSGAGERAHQPFAQSIRRRRRGASGTGPVRWRRGPRGSGGPCPGTTPSRGPWRRVQGDDRDEVDVVAAVEAERRPGAPRTRSRR